MKLKNFKLFTAILSLSFTYFAYGMEAPQTTATTAMGVENSLIGAFVKLNKIEAVKNWLTEDPSNIDFQAKDGTTLLMLAVKKANIDMVKLLLAHNADVFIQNNNHQTALDIARSKNYNKILKLLDKEVVNSIVEIDVIDVDQEIDIDSQAEISTDEDETAIPSEQILLSRKRKQPTSKFTKEKHFKSNPNLTEHNILINEEKVLHKCDQCNYTSAYKANLARHIRTHTGEKPHKCDQCDYASAYKSHLTEHIRTHTGEKPYKCTQCDYACADKSSLTRHIRTHTGEKPYKCNLCNYASAKKSNLTQHIRTHTKEKPYKCDQCDYASAYKSSLTRHIRTHTGEKPHKCAQCDYAYADKSDLTKHINRVHNR